MPKVEWTKLEALIIESYQHNRHEQASTGEWALPSDQLSGDSHIELINNARGILISREKTQ